MGLLTSIHAVLPSLPFQGIYAGSEGELENPRQGRNALRLPTRRVTPVVWLFLLLKERIVCGTIVPKGKHILLARLVEPGKWTLVFSSKSVFQYEPSAKLAEVPLTLEEASDSAELVTIQVTDKDGTGVIEIAWCKMRLSASFKPA